MFRRNKVIALLFSVCMMFGFLSMTTYAQEARISYSDLETPAGEQFDINILVNDNDGEALGDVTVVMEYDSSQIQFESGEGVTRDGDVLTYTVSGDESATQLGTTMTFTALKQGTAKITISEATGTTSAGNTLNFIEGSSTITIAGGTEIEPTQEESDVIETAPTGGEITIQGTTYTLVQELPENKLPDGFSTGVANYNGGQINVGKEEDSGIVIAYLANEAGEEDFFMYNEEEGTFSPFVRMIISETSYIVFLETPTEEQLSDRYVETSLNVSDFEFPTWQDTEMPGFYLMNAINNLGEVSLYRYDVQEQTYQRYVTSESGLVDTQTQASTESASNFIEKYSMYIMIGGAGLLLLFLIILIVVSVKLRNRNLELDDLYDEYGIDEEFDEIPIKSNTKKTSNSNANASAKSQKNKKKNDEFEFEFFDDEDDDYDNERLKRLEATSVNSKRARKSVTRNSKSEDSDIDFIDL